MCNELACKVKRVSILYRDSWQQQLASLQHVQLLHPQEWRQPAWNWQLM